MEEETKPSPRGPDDIPELTVRDLMDQLLSGWRIIVGSILACTLLASAWMWIRSPEYTARLVIMPVGLDVTWSGASSSTLGNLASLAKIGDSAAGGVPTFTRFIELIHTDEVAKRLVERHAADRGLFGGQWDAKTKTWHPPLSPVSLVNRMLSAIFGLPGWQPPTPGSVADRLREDVAIQDFGEAGSGMKALFFSDPDPEFARNLLVWIYQETDALLRDIEREKSSQRLAYLEGKLRETSIREHREGLVQIMIVEERKQMLSTIDGPFAAELLEPATVTDKPTSPKPLLYLFVAFFLGAFLGVFLVFAVDALNPPGDAGA